MLDHDAPPIEIERAGINVIRGLAMDAPLGASSGHQGTAMALAPLAHVLFSRTMRYDAADPTWANRDRFILSCGHASILQYAMLYLTGFGLELDDLRKFRQLGSATPGHPEAGHTLGVEVTTGPLGQGFANSVGMAIAERRLNNLYGDSLVDHHTYVVVSDGDLMEGISHEAGSLAGHLKLSKLIAVFDDNQITIDGGTSLSCGDEVGARFRSYGWNVVNLGEAAEDCDALSKGLDDAKKASEPTMLIVRSEVGFPSPQMTGNPKAHGLALDAAEVSATKQAMGSVDEQFWVPDDVLAFYREAGERHRQDRVNWEKALEEAGVEPGSFGTDFQDLSVTIEDSGQPVATRKASQMCLSDLSSKTDAIIGGSADLTSNTGMEIDTNSPFSNDRAGPQIYFGIREHAQGAITVGIARHGGLLPVAGTFLVFSDYMRPSIRLAAMAKTQCVFVFTHDSVGVGEDGPTHQPVEQVMSLRLIPNLAVIRPADAAETIGAWNLALSYSGPTALVLSRQNLPALANSVEDITTGAYVIRDADSPAVTILATGSEVSVALQAADLLEAENVNAKVVSMPCWEIFDQQSDQFKADLIPREIPSISVEAGIKSGWEKYADASVGMDSFGASGPASEVFDHFGITADNVAARAKQLLSDRAKG